MKLHQDTIKTLITADHLSARIAELGAQITADLQDSERPLFVCNLRGASVFFADLIRHVDLPLVIDFLGTSSYGASTKTSGEVRLQKDLTEPLFGRDVVIVEDIIDSGLTLKYIKTLFETRGAKSVRICSLLDKPSGRRTELVGDYIGFEIPGEFVVGYGLDYDERYRNLPDVCVLDPKVYS